MNIRFRMVRRAIGFGTAGGIAAAAFVHAAWARGSTWPRSSPDELARLVVGQGRAPSPAACWAVAGLLSAASLAVVTDICRPATYGGKRALVRPLSRWGSRSTAGALLASGAGGLVVSGTGVVATSDEFRRQDLRVYSPLCLALGAGAAAIAWNPR
ncbi:hypothetical protein BH24ACT5_BH24ACT5_10600 [soil metagenome]